MRTWLLLSLIAFCMNAEASTYHRFWRGTRKLELSAEQFIQALNQVFIPATVRLGSGNGMIAYHPVLPITGTGLPDELALVSYADQDAYNSLFSSDAGKAYGALHWQYFDRTSSRSLVPSPFLGTVDIEQAYDLKPEYSGWMENTTTVLIYFRGSNEGDSAYLQRAKDHFSNSMYRDRSAGVLDRIALVTKSYWIEYVSATHTIADISGGALVVPTRRQALDGAVIVPGTGLNFQFTSQQ